MGIFNVKQVSSLCAGGETMKKQRVTKKRLEELEEQVFQYEVTLTKIIPREIAQHSDTLTEEIGILLFQRDWLEKEFQHDGTDGALSPFWHQVQELDNIFIKQRWMILHHAYDYYKRERERLKMPRVYWWWYLDELESVELPGGAMARSKLEMGVEVL
jgi:hypothetical protein